MASYLVPLTLTILACFGIQAAALRAVGGRTAKSESNFYSSLGRIQAGAQRKAEVMVLGSSITGRLPDRAQGFDGVANMGCDGGSAVDALRAMDWGILPTAPWIVIEANTLQIALDDKPTEIGRAMQGTWFRVGMKAPFLSAYARPAAFLYSKLLVRRTGDFGGDKDEGDLGAIGMPQKTGEFFHEEFKPSETRLVTELSGILGRLQARGSRTLVVWLPPARRDGSPPPTWIIEIAVRSGSSWWDLGQEAAAGTVFLTDGVHMAAPSAARTVQSLLKGIEHEKSR